jgi:hypothetical protein
VRKKEKFEELQVSGGDSRSCFFRFLDVIQKQAWSARWLAALGARCMGSANIPKGLLAGMGNL